MQKSRSVATLVERLSHSTSADGYRAGLNPAQWSALRYFSNANRFSSTTSAFAHYQGITLGAASQTIGAMVTKRLLKRTRDRADKRQYNVSLTTKAHKITVADPIGNLVKAAFKLAETERAATMAALEKMLVHVLGEKSGAYFGQCHDCRYLQCTRGQGRAGDAFQCTNLKQSLTSEDLEKICVNFGPS